VRAVFDSMLVGYPELRDHLCPDAKFFVNDIVKKAVIRIRIAKGLAVVTEQQQSAQGLFCPTLAGGSSARSFSDMAVPVEHHGSQSHAEKMSERVERQMAGNDTIASHYINLDILASTSLSC
jgi:hypothetical protein